MASVDLSFLKNDVERQLTISRRILGTAKELNELIQTVEDAHERGKLIELRDQMLQAARELARNAEETSTTGSTAIASARRAEPV